jgi:hypothetical protein
MAIAEVDEYFFAHFVERNLYRKLIRRLCGASSGKNMYGIGKPLVSWLSIINAVSLGFKANSMEPQ